MTPEEDNENGPDTLRWFLEHQFQPYPYYTFIFRDRDTGEIVATASFVQDDRGVAAERGLDQDPSFLGLWGLFQVRRELRGRGLGTVISEYVDAHVQKYVNTRGVPQTVYLFTGDQAAMHI